MVRGWPIILEFWKLQLAPDRFLAVIKKNWERRVYNLVERGSPPPTIESMMLDPSWRSKVGKVIVWLLGEEVRFVISKKTKGKTMELNFWILLFGWWVDTMTMKWRFKELKSLEVLRRLIGSLCRVIRPWLWKNSIMSAEIVEHPSDKYIVESMLSDKDYRSPDNG